MVRMKDEGLRGTRGDNRKDLRQRNEEIAENDRS